MAEPKNTVKNLPPYRAPFYFGPEYLGSAAEWKANFTKLLEALLSERNLRWSIDYGFGEWTLRVRFEHTQFVMCARTGMFMFEEYCNEDDALTLDDYHPERWSGPLNSPEKFYEQLLTTVSPQRFIVEVKRVAAFVDELNGHMLRRFKAALACGHAAYEARLGSVRHPFSRLEPDQLQGMEVRPADLDHCDYPGGTENVKLPDANGRGGERFYSVRVISTGAGSRTSATGKPPVETPDARVRYPRDEYDPVIERIVKDVRKVRGKRATQAEVKRRSADEFIKRGLPIPKKTAFDQRVKKIFETI